MASSAEIDRRADIVIKRADELQGSVDQLLSFKCLLERVFSDPIKLDRPHIDALRVVRAGALRSAIGLVCALLGAAAEDRANLKQIFVMLEDSAVAERLTAPNPRRHQLPDRQKLEAARVHRDQLATSDKYKRVQLIRNSLAHLLDEVDTVEYSDVFWLADEIDACVSELLRGIGMKRRPGYLSAKDAALFRKTYLRGAEPTPMGNTT
jgi:hypothetical protein